jgi:hypothetical protein
VILPEKFVRIDQNSTLSVSIAGDETVVEFLQSGDQSAQVDGASCGAGYFITRFPRKFKVRTKYLNASVEGTEFLGRRRVRRHSGRGVRGQSQRAAAAGVHRELHADPRPDGVERSE